MPSAKLSIVFSPIEATRSSRRMSEKGDTDANRTPEEALDDR
jgi:hypothetical protein